MSKRWFDPITGVAKTQDDSPGPGWLAIMAIRMPDGRDIDSTLDGLESWLATAKEGYVSKYSTQLNEVVVDFTGDSAGADRFGDEILPAIQVCRYFSSEREDDIWFVSIDGSVPSYEGDEFDLIPDDPDEDVADIVGGGGGRGGGGPPPIPWDKRVPFPDTGPEPGPPEIPINDEQPDDSTPIEELAKEQADEDLKGIIPDPDGDFEHPDGAPANEKKDRKPCSDCDGTGQKPEDDGAGGDDGDESDSGDGDEGDGDGDESGDGEGDQDEGSEGGGDGEGEGEGEDEDSSPDECETCGGSGQMPDPAGEDGDDGDDGDESGDGDDDAEEEDQPQPDDPYDPAPVVEAANRAIEASNRAVLSDDPAEISEAVDECFRAIGECQQAVDKRSTTQREVLQRALDAGQRALTRLQEVNQ